MLSNKAQKNVTRERRPEPKVTILLAKTAILQHARGFRGSLEFSGFRGNGGSNCGADPPNTRAGGQDDGSYTNSLKLSYLCSPSPRQGEFVIFLGSVPPSKMSLP